MECRFHHVHLICKDLEGVIKFFTDVLGASLIQRRKFGTADGASLDLKGVRINLRVPREDEMMEFGHVDRAGYDHIGVEVDDLQKAMIEIQKEGFEFYTQPQEAYGIRYAFFKGPEGIRIEVVQRLT